MRRGRGGYVNTIAALTDSMLRPGPAAVGNEPGRERGEAFNLPSISPPVVTVVGVADPGRRGSPSYPVEGTADLVAARGLTEPAYVCTYVPPMCSSRGLNFWCGCARVSVATHAANVNYVGEIIV